MANLVRRDPEKRLALIIDAVKHNSRILHAFRESGNVDG